MMIIDKIRAFSDQYTINLSLIPLYIKAHLIFIFIIVAVMLFSWFVVPSFMGKHRKPSEKASSRRATVSNPSSMSVSSHDIRTIAGEDIFSTHLDLARAYIEMGKKNLARKILNHVMKQGSTIHQLQASELLKSVD